MSKATDRTADLLELIDDTVEGAARENLAMSRARVEAAMERSVYGLGTCGCEYNDNDALAATGRCWAYRDPACKHLLGNLKLVSHTGQLARSWGNQSIDAIDPWYAPRDQMGLHTIGTHSGGIGMSELVNPEIYEDRLTMARRRVEELEAYLDAGTCVLVASEYVIEDVEWLRVEDARRLGYLGKE